jgi:cyanate permease
VVACLIAAFVLLEQLSLSDGWRGTLEFLAAIAAIAAVAAWVWTNRTVLQEHEWRQRQHNAGQWRR